MTIYQEQLIEEHKYIVKRVIDFERATHDDNISTDEFISRKLQYDAMCNYEFHLSNRLTVAGITIINGGYYERVANITDNLNPSTSPVEECDASKPSMAVGISVNMVPLVGNDYDKDTETLNKCKSNE